MESIYCWEFYEHTSIFSKVSLQRPLHWEAWWNAFLCKPFTSVTSQKIQPVTFQIDAKKISLSKHHADPHNPQPAEPSIFFHKRGTPFFADRPPGSSYWPRRVESKGAACIPRQPITLCFVGYPIFPVDITGEAQRQSRRNAVGAKAG